jgi:hypothetical protein
MQLFILPLNDHYSTVFVLSIFSLYPEHNKIEILWLLDFFDGFIYQNTIFVSLATFFPPLIPTKSTSYPTQKKPFSSW